MASPVEKLGMICYLCHMAKVMPKEAVGPCLAVMDGGILNLPYGPSVAVAAMCCFHAF